MKLTQLLGQKETGFLYYKIIYKDKLVIYDEIKSEKTII